MLALADAASLTASGSLLAAVPIALAAGLVSFASPCVLPLVPGYLGFVSGMTPDAVARSGVPTRAPQWRIVLGTAMFIAGFSAVFLVYGLAAGSLGGQLRSVSDSVIRVLGVGVIAMGIAFLGGWTFLQRDTRPVPRAGLGLAGAPLLGFAFGLGWTPCIGPTLAVVLTLCLDTASAGRGGLLALVYCLGLGLPFLAMAFAWRWAAGAFEWIRAHRRGFMRVGGIMLIVIGAAMVAGLWQAWTSALQGWIGGFASPL